MITSLLRKRKVGYALCLFSLDFFYFNQFQLLRQQIPKIQHTQYTATRTPYRFFFGVVVWLKYDHMYKISSPTQHYTDQGLKSIFSWIFPSSKIVSPDSILRASSGQSTCLILTLYFWATNSATSNKLKTSPPPIL